MKFTLSTATAFLGLASAAAVSQPQQAANVTNNVFSLDALTGPQPIDFRACDGWELEEVAIFHVEKITIDPKPIKQGGSVHVVVTGQLAKKIEQGASVAIRFSQGIAGHTLDYGRFGPVRSDVDERLLTSKRRIDFCKGIIKGCPAEAGPVEWWTGQHISNVVSPNGSRFACIY